MYVKIRKADVYCQLSGFFMKKHIKYVHIFFMWTNFSHISAVYSYTNDDTGRPGICIGKNYGL